MVGLIGRFESYKQQLLVKQCWLRKDVLTLQTSQTVVVAIAARDCFIEPAWVTEKAFALRVAEVQIDEGVELLYIGQGHI